MVGLGTGQHHLDPLSTSDVESSQHPASADPSARRKRRRVSRACDECRRKKIKCDGRQPCAHCTIYSYDCTYDQPSHRRRNPTPQYMETLERRLQRAEVLLQGFLPNVNLDDEELDGLVAHPKLASKQRTGSLVTHKSETSLSEGNSSQSVNPGLESMVKATGQLDLDERGNWDYHGHSSGLSFLRQTRAHFGNIVGPEQEGQSCPPESRRRKSFYGLHSAGSSTMTSSPEDLVDASISFRRDDLPPKDTAREICRHALDDATCILKVVHRPTFDERMDRIYDCKPDQYESEDHQFLPLLYSVLALGCLFAERQDGKLATHGYDTATEEGYKYFWAAHQLLDVTDCRDLTSLQAIVFITLFLQSSAKLSTCYSYIGVALRSALRMGLHRSFKDNFDPIEAEVRKRVFWVIRTLDTYIGAMLGLPQTLADEDIDQLHPLEVDDEAITVNGIINIKQDRTPIIAASNANFSLTRIVAKIVRRVYPIKGFQHNDDNTSGVYSVGYMTVREIEDDLQQWLDQLPPLFRPGSEAPANIVRIQQLLRIAYAHAQMLLYRPFLHYASSGNDFNPGDPRSFACAAACVSVSRNIIHITAEMQRRKLVVGSDWFAIYATFFAILSLVYYALESASDASDQGILEDARIGKATISQLASRSMAADRCTSTLTTLFQRLPKLVCKTSPSEKEQTHASSRQPKTLSTPLATAVSQADIGKPASQRPNIKRATAPRARPNMRLDLKSLPSFQDHMGVWHLEQLPKASMFSSQSHIHSLHQQTQLSPHHTRPQLSKAELGATHLIPDPLLSSFSAKMFPSPDPFAYNSLQPMAALELSHAALHTGSDGTIDPYQQYSSSFVVASGGDIAAVHQHSTYVPPPLMGLDVFMPEAPGCSVGSADEQLHTQFLGPLTPFFNLAAGNDRGGPSSASAKTTFVTGGATAQHHHVEMWAERVQSGSGGGLEQARENDDVGFEEEWERSIDDSA